MATVTAGRFDPKLRMAPGPVAEDRGAAHDREMARPGRERRTRPGDVHVVLSGLSASSRLAAVALTDTVRGAWSYRASDQVSVSLGPVAGPWT